MATVGRTQEELRKRDGAAKTSAEEASRGSKLEGRVAMVTGGTRGIGAAICRSLAAQGAAVAAGYGGNKERAERFLDELLDTGVEASVHQGTSVLPRTAAGR